MEQPKRFDDMTPEEQLAYCTDFTAWTNDKLNTLIGLGDAWEQSHIKCFEEGLKLCAAFQHLREYVKDSYQFRDYSRRVNMMIQYTTELKERIANTEAYKVATGKTMAVVLPQESTAVRRGRPPKSATTEAATPATTPAADLFTQTVNTQLGDNGRPTLQALSWMLSPSLQVRCREVQSLRAMAAVSAEKAKNMSDIGERAETIAPHAKIAKEHTETYKKIFEDVDVELAHLYRNILENQGYAGMVVEAARRGLSEADFMDMLKGYYDRMSEEVKNNMLADANASPVDVPKEVEETPTTELSAKDREAAIKRISAYMTRKVAPSEKRDRKSVV